MIEVRVKNPLQLFDARDPASFRERDLDDDFIEYIMAAFREFSFSGPVKIDLQKSGLKSFMKKEQLFLLIGLFVLFLCVSIAKRLTIPDPPGTMGILRKGIIIIGWYALFENLRYYKKLLVTEIEINFFSPKVIYGNRNISIHLFCTYYCCGRIFSY